MTAFKDAIKSSTREIKGYVEVLYDNNDIKNRTTITTYADNIFNSDNQMKDEKRVTNNYATFERVFFKTDGSFVLPIGIVSTTQDNSGYISSSISDVNKSIFIEGDIAITAPISGETNSAKGLTFYFDDAYPQNIYWQISYELDGTPYVYNQYDYPTSSVHTINLIYDDITSIYFRIDELQKPYRRLRIKELDFGLTKVYTDDKLIDYKVNENLDPLSIEMTKGEVSVNLSNYDDEFDLLNPSGVVSYLKTGVPIYPYLGVKTLDEGIQYVSMGKYYLTEWNNNQDDTTTLVGQDLFNKLSTTFGTFRAVPGVTSFTPTTYFEMLMTVYGTTDYIVNVSCIDEINDQTLPLGSILEQLQALAIFSNAVCYVDRNGTLRFEDLSTTLEDSITLDLMLSKPLSRVNNELKKLTFNITSLSGLGGVIEIHNSSQTINGTEQVVLRFEKPFLVTDIVVTGGTLDNVDYGGMFLILTISATGVVSIEVTAQVYETSVITKEIINSDIGEEIIINNAYIHQEFTDFDRINNYYLANYYNYNFDVVYNGDPTLEKGDIVSLETSYGNKNMRIKQNQFNFNGGLSCNIKGDGN